MARITLPPVETATGATAEVYAQVKKAVGKIPNAYGTVAAYRPEILKAMLSSEAVLAAGTLSKTDQETIKLLVSSVVDCDYCVAAHSLIGKLAGLSAADLTHIRAGEPTGDTKRDALIQFVKQIQTTAGTLGDEDFAAIRTAGYTDAEVIDISFAISLITFTNVFNRINDTVVDFPAVK